MEKRIVIATHGRFAEGIYDSLKMIVGDVKNVEVFTAYVDDAQDYSKEIATIVSNHDYDEKQLVVITDLFGGSINNEFMQYVNQYPFYLLTGLNLGLLLSLVITQQEITPDCIESLIAENRTYVKWCRRIDHYEEDESF